MFETTNQCIKNQNEEHIDCLVGGFNPSEKYESQLGLLFPIYGKSPKCSKPPTSCGSLTGSQNTHHIRFTLVQIWPFSTKIVLSHPIYGMYNPIDNQL